MVKNKQKFVIEKLETDQIFQTYYKDLLKGYYEFNSSLYGDSFLKKVTLNKIAYKKVSPFNFGLDYNLKQSLRDIYNLLDGYETMVGLFSVENEKKELKAFGRIKNIYSYNSISLCEIICKDAETFKEKRSLYKKFIQNLENEYVNSTYDSVILDVPNNDFSYQEIVDDLKYELIEDEKYDTYPTKQYQKKLLKKRYEEYKKVRKLSK